MELSPTASAGGRYVHPDQGRRVQNDDQLIFDWHLGTAAQPAHLVDPAQYREERATHGSRQSAIIRRPQSDKGDKRWLPT